MTGTCFSSIVDNVSGAVVRAYDPEYGGFGGQPKFPMVSDVELLLHLYQSSGDAQYRSMVERTLDNMVNGGLYDHEEGGFFRYSTARDWSGPHFEKTLADNADLLRLYLGGHLITGNEKYAYTASAIAGYLDGHLYDSSAGAFHGGGDADEQYYILSLDRRRQRKPPPVDPVYYTGTNAKVALAYLKAAWVLGRPELTDVALMTLDYLLAQCGEWPLRHGYSRNGDPEYPAVVSDYGYLVTALVDGHAQTSRRHYLDAARSLAGEMIETFWDKEGAGFFDICEDPQAGRDLKMRQKSLSGNVPAVDALVRLFYSTFDEEYHSLAETALGVFLPVYESCGESAAGYALAVDQFLHSPVEITVLGRSGDSSTKALLRAAATIAYPHIAVKFVDSSNAESVAEAGYWAADEPLAYVCLDTMCLAPIDDPESLHRTVGEFLKSRTQGIGGIVQGVADII